MEKKYRLTNETIKVCGHTLYRIIALKDFSDIKTGDKGGYIESEKNLSQYNDAWVYDTATVFEEAIICNNVRVYNNARVFGNAEVYDNACVFGNAMVYGNTRVCGEAIIRDDAKICSMKDYIVFKNWWSSGRYFTWTRSNNMWSVGCFYGTGEQLIKKAYEDSELSGREYEKIVKYVESILHDEK